LAGYLPSWQVLPPAFTGFSIVMAQNLVAWRDLGVFGGLAVEDARVFCRHLPDIPLPNCRKPINWYLSGLLVGMESHGFKRSLRLKMLATICFLR